MELLTSLNINWTQLLTDLTKFAAAFLLAFPIAYNREQSTRIMGLRTFPLVAVASCGYVLVGMRIISPGADDAQARILQGLITGIGFIGGGAILKEENRVLGTATAASIWSTGAVGAATGFGRYEIAVVISILNFLVLRWLTPLKEEIDEKNRSNESIEEP